MPPDHSVFTDMPTLSKAVLPAHIEHVIVLMLENRSFDHMLGYLDHPDESFDGLQRPSYDDGNAPLATTKNARYSIYPGPGHSLESTMHQLLGSKRIPSNMATATITNSGFADNYELRQRAENKGKGYGEKVMRCFDPRMVPVLSTLAKEFAVCDKWFCSAPMGTFPNRDFLHAGTAYGRSNNKPFFTRDQSDSIFFRLQNGRRKGSDTNSSWRNYSHPSGAHLWTYPGLFFANVNNANKQWKHLDGLPEDIRLGNLPTYAFVEPDYGDYAGGLTDWRRGNSQHPSQADSLEEFVAGESLIAEIYNALLDSPSVFEKTAFLITYDEHGGFYDHVPPPTALQPGLDSCSGTDLSGNSYEFKYDLLGPRVPAVIISPWINRGKVDHTTYEHTSIYETLRRTYAPESLPSSDRRVSTFSGVFERTEARKPLPSSASDGVDLSGYMPRVEPLSVERAKALERELAAPRDDADENPKYDSSLHEAVRDLPKPW